LGRHCEGVAAAVFEWRIVGWNVLSGIRFESRGASRRPIFLIPDPRYLTSDPMPRGKRKGRVDCHGPAACAMTNHHIIATDVMICRGFPYICRANPPDLTLRHPARIKKSIDRD
jgi:hypothetical protein